MRKSRAQLRQFWKNGYNFGCPSTEFLPGRPRRSKRRKRIVRDPIDIAGVGLLLRVLEGLHHGRKNLVLPEPETGWSWGSSNGFVIEVVQEIELGGGQDERITHRYFLSSNVDLKAVPRAKVLGSGLFIGVSEKSFESWVPLLLDSPNFCLRYAPCGNHQVWRWNEPTFVQSDWLPALMMRTVHGELAELDLIILRVGVPLVKPVHNEGRAPRARSKMGHHYLGRSLVDRGRNHKKRPAHSALCRGGSSRST